MTLFALHLASVLKAQPQLQIHIMNIQDIIDEQDAARLLEHEGDIIESLGEIHEGTRLHHDANCMAAEIRDYLQNARAQMERAGLSGVEHVSRLCDYADQLQAHHLDKLERLTRA